MTNMYGLVGRSSTFQNSSQTWTMTTNASAWDVFYTGLTTGTHNFSYKLDAGAVTPLTTSGYTAVSPGQRVRLGPLARPGTSHTLQLAGSTGSPIVEGVYVYNGDESAGIRVWEAGHLGATTGTWLTSGILPLQLLAYIQPALVVVALGINDFLTALTPAAITGNLNSLISTVRAYCAVPPSVVLFIEHPIIAAFAYREPWDNYVQALYQYALNDGDIYVVDMNERVGNPPAQIASLSTGTPGLPNDIAHKMWADALAYALLP